MVWAEFYASVRARSRMRRKDTVGSGSTGVPGILFAKDALGAPCKFLVMR